MLADLKSITSYYHLDDEDLSKSLQPFLEMAVLITQSDVAYISTFDNEWQYFLSTDGFEGKPIQRSTSICNLTLQQKDPLIIEDMDHDPRKPGDHYDHLGFYVGIPLINQEDLTIGTFCIMGGKPKKLANHEQELLIRLRKQIIGFLERRRELIQFQEVWADSNHAIGQERRKIQDLKSKLAHDFKGPLGNLKQAGELVKEGGINSIEEYMVLFDQSHQTIEHLMSMMKHLTEEVLFEKKHNNQSDLETIELEKLISSIVEINQFQEKYGDTQITVKPSITFNGSYLDLFLVFQNLIENGLKYNHSEVKEIMISAEENNEVIRFLIEDNGVGIPVESQSTIFEKGRRLAQDVEGSGLGLYNVKEILSKHQASISVNPGPEMGSVFTIVLPK